MYKVYYNYQPLNIHAQHIASINYKVVNGKMLGVETLLFIIIFVEIRNDLLTNFHKR